MLSRISNSPWLSAACALVGLVLVTHGRAQTPPAGLNFDVVSIKPSAPMPMLNGRGRVMRAAGCRGGPGSGDPGRLTCESVTLAYLIQAAYDIKPYQLTALDWMNGGGAPRFDMVATFPPGTSEDQLREMGQNFLAQRFGLVIHHETKQLPTEVLAVAKGGPKLTQSAPVGGAPAPAPRASGGPPPLPPPMGPDGFPEMPRSGPPGVNMMMMSPSGMRVVSYQQTMEGLVELLSRFTGQPVTDNTGLTGKYDITLTFSPDGLAIMGGRRGPPPPPPPPSGGNGRDSAEPPPPQPRLEAALQQQLGLKLEHQKAMVAMIVVDKAEKAPTPN